MLPAGAEANEIRETMRIQAAGSVDGMKPLPEIPIAVLTSMKSDPKAALSLSPMWTPCHGYLAA